VHFEDEFVVEKTPDEVFRLLADAERIPEWMVEFERVEQVSDTEPGVGTEYCCHPVKPPRGNWTFEWAEYQPGKRLAYTGDTNGPVQRTGSYDISPNGGDDTTVRMVIEPRFGWPMKLVSPLFALLLRKHARRDATALRRWLSSAAVALGVVYTNTAEMLDGFSQWAVGLSSAL
jgi:uncharacterized protein YndB with AHSA1/START domain